MHADKQVPAIYLKASEGLELMAPSTDGVMTSEDNVVHIINIYV